MKTPIPFMGWIEEDELLEFLHSVLKTNSSTYTFGHKRLQEIVEKIEHLQQEKEFYKNEFERSYQAASKNSTTSSH